MDQTKNAQKTSKSRCGAGKINNKSQNQAKLIQNKLESKLAPTFCFPRSAMLPKITSQLEFQKIIYFRIEYLEN